MLIEEKDLPQTLMGLTHGACDHMEPVVTRSSDWEELAHIGERERTQRVKASKAEREKQSVSGWKEEFV